MSATTQLVNVCRKVGLIAAVVLLAACGGDDGDVAAPGPVAPAPSTGGATPTPIGTASGAATSATIGAAGGTLSSSDGRIKVAIPAGALASDTTISIQPITNNAHGGLGAGYRLTPDGQTFSQPVALTFAYTDQDLAGSDSDVLGAAFQTAGGFWQWLGTPLIDGAAKTLKVSTTHFTDVALVEGIRLLPQSKKLGVNESLALRVVTCYRNAVFAEDLQPLGLACATAFFDPEGWIVTVSDWEVNQFAGGNSTLGTVSGDGPNATYRAPAAKPTPNMVGVSARIVHGQAGQKKFRIVSNITIGGDTAYVGSVAFGINLGEGAVVVSNAVATVTWSQFEDLGDTRRYVPSGTITAESVSIAGCDTLSNVTVPIEATVPGSPGSTLVVYTQTNVAFPKSYQFALAADPKTMLTFMCGTETKVAVRTPLPVAFNVGNVCPNAPPQELPKFTDENQLSGSYQCASQGLVARWDFKQ